MDLYCDYFNLSVYYRPPRNSRLLKDTTFLESANEFNTTLPPIDKHPRGEIWRSETVLTVFLDLWLSNDQVGDLRKNNYNISPVRVGVIFVSFELFLLLKFITETFINIVKLFLAIIKI